MSVNHELRDLVALATMLYLDEREQQEGWEAFPDTHAAARSYKDDVKQHLESQQQLATAAWHAEGGMTDGVAPARGSLDAASGGSQADRDVLALEPPQWLPDSFASACGGCHLQFRPITRLKHHCRWVRRRVSLWGASERNLRRHQKQRPYKQPQQGHGC